MTKKPSKDYRTEPFKVVEPAAITFGLPAPKAARITWGYRGIKEPGGFSLLHDRQSFLCFLGEKDPLRKAFKKAIDTAVIPALRAHAETLSSTDGKTYFYRFPGILDGEDLLAIQSPQSSHGYMYGAVWLL